MPAARASRTTCAPEAAAGRGHVPVGQSALPLTPVSGAGRRGHAASVRRHQALRGMGVAQHGRLLSWLQPSILRPGYFGAPGALPG